MTNTVFRFFPEPIFKYKIQNYEKQNQDLSKYIYDLYNNDKESLKKSNVGGWHSKAFNLKDNKSPPFIFFQNIKAQINDVFQKYGWVFTPEKIKCEEMWAIINKKGNFNVEHIHANCDLSAAYYVKVPENSGNFQIFNPNSVSRNRFPKKSKPTEFNIVSAVLKIEEGDLIIFPSYLPHAVGQNETDEDRIVLSFNLSVQS